MRAGRRRAGSFWPTTAPELLLRTALSPEADSRRAWRTLGPEFDPRALAPGAISVLPLLYRRLLVDAPEDPRLPHLKGVYRNAWVRNNLLAEQLKAILAAFRSADIPVILVGSLGAAVRYYEELGLRPTPALDLLVPAAAIPGARRALGALAFSAGSAARPDGAPVVLRNASGHACVLRSTAAAELELDHAALATTAVTIEINGESVRAPEAGHDLLAACVAGARVKPVRSVQWVVDMSRMVGALAPADWDRVGWMASEQGQRLRLERALLYLSTLSMKPPPIEHRVTGVREYLAYRLAGTEAPRLESLPHALAVHLVATRDRSPGGALAALPEFLRHRWGLEHVRQVPLAGGRRALKPLRGRPTRTP